VIPQKTTDRSSCEDPGALYEDSYYENLKKFKIMTLFFFFVLEKSFFFFFGKNKQYFANVMNL
jgi:hypothetical protein